MWRTYIPPTPFPSIFQLTKQPGISLLNQAPPGPQMTVGQSPSLGFKGLLSTPTLHCFILCIANKFLAVTPMCLNVYTGIKRLTLPCCSITGLLHWPLPVSCRLSYGLLLFNPPLFHLENSFMVFLTSQF